MQKGRNEMTSSVYIIDNKYSSHMQQDLYKTVKRSPDKITHAHIEIHVSYVSGRSKSLAFCCTFAIYMYHLRSVYLLVKNMYHMPMHL